MSNPLETILNFTQEDLASLTDDQLTNLIEQVYRFKAREFHEDVSTRGIAEVNAAISELRRKSQDPEYLADLRKTFQTVKGTSTKKASGKIKTLEGTVEAREREIQKLNRELESTLEANKEAIREKIRYEELYTQLANSDQGIAIEDTYQLLLDLERTWKAEDSVERRKRVYMQSANKMNHLEYTGKNGTKLGKSLKLSGSISEVLLLTLMPNFHEIGEGLEESPISAEAYTSIPLIIPSTKKPEGELFSSRIVTDSYLVTHTKPKKNSPITYHIEGRITNMERIDPFAAKDKENETVRRETLEFLMANPGLANLMEIQEDRHRAVLRKCFYGSLPNAYQYAKKELSED